MATPKTLGAAATAVKKAVKPVLFIEDFVEATKRPWLSLFLNRLYLWKPEKMRERGQHRWLTFTVDEWAKLMGVTGKIMKTTMAEAKAMGAIIHEVHLISGVTRSHIRLNPDFILHLIARKGTIQEGPPGDYPGKVPTGTFLEGPIWDDPLNNNKKDNNMTNQQEAFATAHAEIGQGPSQEVLGKEGEKDMKNMKNGIGNMGGTETKTHSPGPKKPTGPHALHLLWTKLLAEAHGVRCMTLTVVEKGQLKTWVEYATALDIDPAEALEKVLREWGGYCSLANTKLGAGGFGGGEIPRMAFILSTRAVLGSFCGPTNVVPFKPKGVKAPSKADLALAKSLADMEAEKAAKAVAQAAFEAELAVTPGGAP